MPGAVRTACPNRVALLELSSIPATDGGYREEDAKECYMDPIELNDLLEKWADGNWLAKRVPHFITQAADRADIAHQAWCRLKVTDPAGIRDPEAYARKMLYRLAVNHVSGRAATKNHVQATDETLDGQYSEERAHLLPEAGYEHNQRKELLYQAIDRLPLQRRQMVYFRLVKGLSVREIAERMRVTPGNVYKELEKAFEALERDVKRALGNGNSEEG
jgi:RNA polymerase sigma factor (sigma-70 family)